MKGNGFWKCRYEKICKELSEERKLRKQAEWDVIQLSRENKAMREGRKMAKEIMKDIIVPEVVN